MKFIDKVINSIESKHSHVCVGLDSRYDRLPEIVKKGNNVSQTIFQFNREVVKATSEVAAAYKANIAFYGGFGAEGLEGLRLTNEWIKNNYPVIPLFADCKRSEMGESVKMIKQEVFDWLNFDCVMVTPWFGLDTVKDYLDIDSQGVCVYVHDSNPTAKEFQDLELKDGRLVYEVVTENVVKYWNMNGNVMIEAGATYSQQLKRARVIAGNEIVMLVAGIGTQGATIDQLDKSIYGKDGLRMLVNSSRGIIFAGEGKNDYFEAVHDAAHTLRTNLINHFNE